MFKFYRKLFLNCLLGIFIFYPFYCFASFPEWDLHNTSYPTSYVKQENGALNLYAPMMNNACLYYAKTLSETNIEKITVETNFKLDYAGPQGIDILYVLTDRNTGYLSYIRAYSDKITFYAGGISADYKFDSSASYSSYRIILDGASAKLFIDNNLIFDVSMSDNQNIQNDRIISFGDRDCSTLSAYGSGYWDSIKYKVSEAILPYYNTDYDNEISSYNINSKRLESNSNIFLSNLLKKENDSLVSYINFNDYNDFNVDKKTGDKFTNSSVSYSKDGAFSSAAYFPITSTSYLSLDNKLVNGLTNFTFGFWMKTDSTDASNSIISIANSSNDNEFVVQQSNSNLDIYIQGSVYIVSTSSLNTINNNIWNFITLTRDVQTATLKIYVNGDLLSSQTSCPVSPISVSSNGFILGQEQDSVGGGFEVSQAYIGYLDEFAIWNRALSNSEISEIYNQKNKYVKYKVTGKIDPVIFDPLIRSKNSFNTSYGGEFYGDLEFNKSYINKREVESLKFSDNYIIYPENRYSNFRNGFSFGAWIKLDSDENVNTIFSKNDGLDLSNTTYFLDIREDNSEIYFGGYNDDYNIFDYNFSENVWYYISGIDDSENMKIYVNGVLIGEGDSNLKNRVISSDWDFRIGGRQISSTTNNFDGSIYDFAIWDRILSESEINSNYKNNYGPASRHEFVYERDYTKNNPSMIDYEDYISPVSIYSDPLSAASVLEFIDSNTLQTSHIIKDLNYVKVLGDDYNFNLNIAGFNGRNIYLYDDITFFENNNINIKASYRGNMVGVENSKYPILLDPLDIDCYDSNSCYYKAISYGASHTGVATSSEIDFSESDGGSSSSRSGLYLDGDLHKYSEDIILQNGSIQFWVDLSSKTGNKQLFDTKFISSSKNRLTVKLVDENLRIYLYDSDGNIVNEIISEFANINGNLVYFTFTFDGENFNIYTNGKYLQTLTTVADFEIPIDFTLGRDYYSDSYYANSTFYDLAIYSYKKELNEIQNDYYNAYLDGEFQFQFEKNFDFPKYLDLVATDSGLDIIALEYKNGILDWKNIVSHPMSSTSVVTAGCGYITSGGNQSSIFNNLTHINNTNFFTNLSSVFNDADIKFYDENCFFSFSTNTAQILYSDNFVTEYIDGSASFLYSHIDSYTGNLYYVSEIDSSNYKLYKKQNISSVKKNWSVTNNVCMKYSESCYIDYNFVINDISSDSTYLYLATSSGIKVLDKETLSIVKTLLPTQNILKLDL